MSIFGAMQSGISGLAAQSSAMGAISDNIVNVNTVGYKGANTSFQTLVTKQTSTSRYSPGGVQPSAKQGVNVQGLLASVSSSTSMGISGQGYFVVNQAANPGEGDLWAYTRAGDFDIDNNGYLKNTGGFYAQGWSLLPWDKNPNATVVNINGIDYMKAYYDTNGKVVYINDNIIDSRNLRPINLNTIGGTATATQQISYGANLPSGDPIYNASNPDAGGRHSVSALIYDSLGNASNLSLTYTKTASNAWGMSTSIPSGASNIVLSGSRETHGDTASDVYYAAGQLEFSGIPSNGSTITITSGGKEYTFEFLSTKGAHAQPGNIGVDISTGIASASDFANKFLEALQANMPGANRFSANGNKIEIVQSVSGEALQIDASKTLACIQSAANPNLETGIATGIFDIPAIDEDIKNCGRLDFTSNDKADYVNTTVKVGDKTYKFVDGATATPGEIDISSAFDGSAANPAAAVAELLVKSIKADSVEPERFTASGSSIEILPSSTGPDIKITVNNTGGGDAITGRIRSTAPLGWSDVANGTEYTLSNTFNVNYNEIETGSIVPSVRFNADGTPKYFFVDEVSIQWANGAQNMDGGYQQGTTITLNAGNVGTNDGLTSLSGDFTTNYITQDGAKFGSYSGVSISKDGVVTALFDNGETRPIAILPLATFANPNGMEALTGNSWIETDYSGQAMLKQAGTNGAGQISSNSLEQSTVDLATEFSNMIVTQRAYSAATKIITTADEMLDELTRMS